MAKQTFAPIPNSLLKRPDVSYGAKLCCARLIQYAGKTNYAYPKLETLIKELSMPKRTLQRFLTELQKKGLIKIQRRGLGKSNMYYLNDAILIHMHIPDMPNLAPQKMPKLTTPEMPILSPPYNKEEKDNLKRKMEEITSKVVDKLRVRG